MVLHGGEKEIIQTLENLGEEFKNLELGVCRWDNLQE
jgi:hypothetical protein